MQKKESARPALLALIYFILDIHKGGFSMKDLDGSASFADETDEITRQMHTDIRKIGDEGIQRITETFTRSAQKMTELTTECLAEMEKEWQKELRNLFIFLALVIIVFFLLPLHFL